MAFYNAGERCLEILLFESASITAYGRATISKTVQRFMQYFDMVPLVISQNIMRTEQRVSCSIVSIQNEYSRTQARQAAFPLILTHSKCHRIGGKTIVRDVSKITSLV